MRYMFLIYLDEAKFAVMTEAQRQHYVDAMLEYDTDLVEGGHMVSSDALKAPTTAVTLRKWDGKLSTHDGPFMETKEHLSGFIMVEARDMNAALDLAAKMPLAAVGSIEVRPVETLVHSRG